MPPEHPLGAAAHHEHAHRQAARFDILEADTGSIAAVVRPPEETVSSPPDERIVPLAVPPGRMF